MPMDCGQLETMTTQNVQVVPIDPDVKSAETRKLFNAGMSAKAKTGKTTDPACYDDGTVKGRTGLFEIVEMKMERTVALKTLGRLLGKKLGYRVDAKAPTQEERAEAKTVLTQAIEERNKLREQRDARSRAILAADSEYQSLFVDAKAASKRTDELSSLTRHYKITVGTSEGMFFLIKAEGDTWEEVIGKLTAKEKQSA